MNDTVATDFLTPVYAAYALLSVALTVWLARVLGQNGRVFLDRVPLPGPALCTILVTSAWSYAVLSETVEAWGFRLMQQEDRYLDRPTVARRWYAEEFQPVVRMLRAADLVDERTDAEAYLDLACQRYRLMRTHRWDEDVVQRLRAARA